MFRAEPVSPLARRLLTRGAPPRDTVAPDQRLDEAPTDFDRIRCPLCLWQPRPADRWSCVACEHPEYFPDGCGTVWNTFTTRGRCPGCDHQWRWTSCLACHGWSPHEAWYTGTDA